MENDRRDARKPPETYFAIAKDAAIDWRFAEPVELVRWEGERASGRHRICCPMARGGVDVTDCGDANMTAPMRHLSPIADGSGERLG